MFGNRSARNQGHRRNHDLSENRRSASLPPNYGRNRLGIVARAGNGVVYFANDIRPTDMNSNCITALLAFLLLLRPAFAQIEMNGGKFDIHFERSFRSHATVLGATDELLFVSDVGTDPADTRPQQGIARITDDGSVLGYDPRGRQTQIRLVVCSRRTGETLHTFSGPVTRKPRVSGFELPLTSPPVMVDDGFVFLTADWRLQRIRLPCAGAGENATTLWDLDLPVITKLTPLVNDDIGYILPGVTKCGDALVFTFNSSPAAATAPFQLNLAIVGAADGKLRHLIPLGPAGALDCSPTCIPLADEGRFAVVTPTGDIQTFSIDGRLHRASRPITEYVPRESARLWGGDVWNLFRLDANRLISFAGGHPETEKGKDYPLCAVRMEPSGSIATIWQTTRPSGFITAPALGKNLYFRAGSELTAISPDTGKIVWHKTIEEDSLNYAWTSPIVHDGLVYHADLDGLHVYRDGPECVLVGKVEFSERHTSKSKSIYAPSAHAPPVIRDGVIYIGVEKTVYALKLPLFPEAGK